jgi:outer membrane protein TolC
MKKNIILFTLLFLAMMAWAETLTLDEVRSIALEKNLDLKAEQQNVKATRASMVSSAAGLIPSASITGNYSRFSSRVTSYVPGTESSESSINYTIRVDQPIFNGGKILLGAAMKKDELNIANAQFDDKILETIATAESKYFDYLKSMDFMMIAKKSLTIARDNLETATLKFDNGLLSKADLLKMETESVNKEISDIQQSNLMEISKIDFANYLQIDSDFELLPVKYEDYTFEIEKIRSMDKAAYESIMSKIVAYGLKNNASIKISEESCDISKKSLLMAEGNFLPSVNLSYMNDWSKYDTGDDYLDNQTIALVASIPIFPIVDNAANLKGAYHNNKRSKYSNQSTKNSIELMLRRSLLTFMTTAKSVKSAYLSLSLSNQTYEQMEERFKANMISSTEILDVEVLLESSKLQFTASFYDYLNAKSQLKRYLGITDADEFNSLITY